MEHLVTSIVVQTTVSYRFWTRLNGKSAQLLSPGDA
jgi:hypothetical protein